ncbi:MAG TPA: hypothetical protein VFV17_04575, partial [Usitatibacteraceae bacterium]|nr:hypothetical protein [Usitatibacteraceae bacterium]
MTETNKIIALVAGAVALAGGAFMLGDRMARSGTQGAAPAAAAMPATPAGVPAAAPVAASTVPMPAQAPGAPLPAAAAAPQAPGVPADHEREGKAQPPADAPFVHFRVGNKNVKDLLAE